jgi:HTH-type transcriptional regulator, sugar sensing transcriptional regulator
VNDRVVKALSNLGLKSNEARAYLALLRHGPGTAAEVADAAGVARPKIYEALKSLEQRGFCSVSVDRIARFVPVAPDAALGEWTRRRAHDREIATHQDQRLAHELVSILPEPGGRLVGDAGGYMDARVGVDQTLEMFEEITSRAVSRLDVVISSPVIQPREHWSEFEIGALRRGVGVRVIYEAALVADEERYRPLVEAGGEARCATQLPLKMIVRDDGAEATVSLVDDSNGDVLTTTVAIRHRELAVPFQLLFNRQWRQARVLPEGRGRGPLIDVPTRAVND